jgi:zinc transporter ZupT
MIGALLAIFLSERLEVYLGLILAFTAGMFIYIASANLIPELQHADLKERKWHRAVYFLVGIVAVYLTIIFLHFE